VQALARAAHDFRDPTKGRYVKLIDGGVTDNYGLTSIQQSRLLLGSPYGPLSEKDAITVRKLLFVVVDAGQGPSGDWDREQSGPSGLDLANAAIDSAIDTNVRMSYDSFVPMMRRWQDDIVQYRCGLPAARKAEITAGTPDWRCDDVHFVVTRISFADLGPERARRLNAIPTRLQLPEAEVDEAIAAGRDAMLRNARVIEFLQ
jgi:NTE family protein